MKKTLQYIGFFGLLIMSLSTNAQERTKVEWLSWEEAIERSEVEPRKFFIDVYTDWCGWCKRMDKATFQKPHIAKYLNENYYSIKFNAESTQDITFNGKTYKYIKQGRRGYHELAVAITKGRLSFPTIVFIDEAKNVIQPIPGFRSPDEFEIIMTYFGYDFYRKTPWNIYKEDYIPMRKKSAIHSAEQVPVISDEN